MAAAAAGADADAELEFEFFPIIRRYKSGRVERFMNVDPLPAGTDPATGVISKDVVIDPAVGLWARLFLPPGARQGKLPVVVYYHGGAYVVGSAADPFTHHYLNGLAAEAGDSLRDRGVWYYEKLKASGYAGEVDLLESMGEGHVFFCMDPHGEKAREMQARILSFLRK
uniref:Alpha/beta hydrolase fold-3 domain-containing protein n=1 Tax=Oryza brachyantha TaxID=4533 RepID=J3MCC7_ORYBR